MDHIVVLEAAHHVDDGVHLADVGQELVAESLPLAGSLDQPGDIDELHPGGDQFLRTGNGGEFGQPLIGHRHDARVGLDRAERIVGGFGLGIGHQGIEQGRLTDVGQSDDSGFEHG